MTTRSFLAAGGVKAPLRFSCGSRCSNAAGCMLGLRGVLRLSTAEPFRAFPIWVRSSFYYTDSHSVTTAAVWTGRMVAGHGRCLAGATAPEELRSSSPGHRPSGRQPVAL